MKDIRHTRQSHVSQSASSHIQVGCIIIADETCWQRVIFQVYFLLELNLDYTRVENNLCWEENAGCAEQLR